MNELEQLQTRCVSHEIRNQVSICEMYSEIIKKNLEKERGTVFDPNAPKTGPLPGNEKSPSLNGDKPGNPGVPTRPGAQPPNPITGPTPVAPPTGASMEDEMIREAEEEIVEENIVESMVEDIVDENLIEEDQCDDILNNGEHFFDK